MTSPCRRRAAARLALAPALAVSIALAACTTGDAGDLIADPTPLTTATTAPPTPSVTDPGPVVTDPPADPVEPAPPAEPPADAADAAVAMERDLFERLNDERIARGLAPLEWDDRLAELAREWSAELAATGRFEHRDLAEALGGGRLDGFVGVGENIYGASGPLPAGNAHVGWMQSPSHRSNLLTPAWEVAGIGVVCTADGGVYATQNFGRMTLGGDQPDPDDPPPQEPIARPVEDGPTC
jgi:uncharacterized protein YkwD